MTYAEIISHLFIIYMMMLGTAFLLSMLHRRNDNWVQVGAYAVTLLIFQVCMGGEAQHYHRWWYLINASVDVYIALCAVVIKAPSSAWVAWLGMLMTGVDLTFFVAVESGNRLPGIIYFAGVNALESAQIGAMIVLSGPAVPFLLRLYHFAKRERHWPWTHHRLIQA